MRAGQQSRRAARAADGRLRIPVAARDRVGQDQASWLVRRAYRWPRVHDQAAAGLDGRAGACALTYLIAGPPRSDVRMRQLAHRRRDDGRGQRAPGRWRCPCGPARGRTSAAAPTGSIWNLIFGYDGFGRIFGRAAGGDGGGASFGGAPGWLRMFNEQVGGQVAWLIPLAAIGLLRRAVADPTRPAHRPPTGGPGAVRNLGDRRRRCVQQPAGDLSPLLRQCACTRDRCPGPGLAIVMLVSWARSSWAV